jgi:hypothetical protein
MAWHMSRAMMESFGSLPCSQGPEVGFSQGSNSGGGRSAQSNGNPIPQAYLCSDRMKAFSRLSRFGMTFAPLTGDLGEAVLTSFLAAFPAKISALQERVQGSKGSEADCGPKWRGSLTKYDHDSHSWRTHQFSLLGGLEQFSETWPRWGTMQNGECWEQPMWERRISETESGFWPTPTATDYKGSPCLSKVEQRAQQSARGVRLPEEMTRRGDIGPMNPTWVEWLIGWPLGWTDLKPSATGSAHNAPLKRGGD